MPGGLKESRLDTVRNIESDKDFSSNTPLLSKAGAERRETEGRALLFRPRQ